MSQKQRIAYVKTQTWPVAGFVAIGGRLIEYERAKKIVRFLKKRGRYAYVSEVVLCRVNGVPSKFSWREK